MNQRLQDNFRLIEGNKRLDTEISVVWVQYLIMKDPWNLKDSFNQVTAIKPSRVMNL